MGERAASRDGAPERIGRVAGIARSRWSGFVGFVCLAIVLGAASAPHASAQAHAAVASVRGIDPNAVAVALLPTAGTPTRATDAARLVERLQQRLRSHGWSFTPVPAARVEFAEGVLSCDAPTCASAGLDALGAGAVAAPALWDTRGGGCELTIAVLGPSGSRLELAVPVPDVNDSAPADALADQLLQRWPEIAFVPEPPSDADVSTRPRVRSGWNAVIGLGLLGGAIAPLALGVTAAVRDGDCEAPRPDGGCVVDPQSGEYREYSFGPRSYALIGVGALAVGVGTYFLAAGPIRVTPSASRTHAGIVVGGAF